MIIEPLQCECNVVATGLLLVFGDLAKISAAWLMETGMNNAWD